MVVLITILILHVVAVVIIIEIVIKSTMNKIVIINVIIIVTGCILMIKIGKQSHQTNSINQHTIAPIILNYLIPPIIVIRIKSDNYNNIKEAILSKMELLPVSTRQIVNCSQFS